MPKAYWIATYRKINDADAFAAYAKLAGPALQAAGGRFLARGNPAQVYDNAPMQRAVLIEFDSVAQAVAAHDSDATSRRSSTWRTTPSIARSGSSRASSAQSARLRSARR
jgi:uncharacterized protein (DUF1330 family)